MSQKKRVAINGLGRIGRCYLKIALAQPDIEIVAANDLTDINMLAHLIQFDSVYGPYEREVSVEGDQLVIGGVKIKVFSEKDPSKLPWAQLGVDAAIESTGFFTDYDGASKHQQAGAKFTIISANSDSPEKIHTYVLKVNTDKFDPTIDQVTSMGSCTTNCLAPVAKVLQDSFGIKKGLMTTTHSYTSTQSLVDGPNDDMRRARAASLSQIPTTTGAAKAIYEVLPELKGKMDGRAIRVPTPTVSLVDLTCELEKDATVEQLNAAFTEASTGYLSGVLGTEKRPLVSMDYRKNPHGSIVDLPLTMSIGGNLAKVYSWYDNEWGYCTRLVEYTQFVASHT